MKNGIIVLDFGSQYTKLIARKVRELNVYSKILPYYSNIEIIQEFNPSGIILSGGPSSINVKDASLIKKKIYELGVPILGICYGMQVTAHLFGGIVSKGKKSEYGKSKFTIQKSSDLFKNTPKHFIVWMSHFDEVIKIPNNFEVIGRSSTSIAAIQNLNDRIFGIQFHPEVSDSEFGEVIIKNFVLLICNSPKNWIFKKIISSSIEKIAKEVKKEKVILALSGGLDSSVTALLLQRAIGNQLICIVIDNGFLRKNEIQKITQMYRTYFNLQIKIIDASCRFLNNLIGIYNPEEKRKQIGKDFIEVFYEEIKNNQTIKFLAQGTIYSDIIESKSSQGLSSIIKSHHNVGGLPNNLKFKLIEPLKDLFKDEVRKLGLQLGLPYNILYKHPFPGPGLAIRILGEVSEKKIKILQKADYIFIEELISNNLYYQVSQAFVVLLPLKSVGVMGDERTYEYILAIRSVNTTNFMTATWSRFPYEFLEKVSNRIINEVQGINRVVYDISSKPPSTIEWE